MEEKLKVLMQELGNAINESLSDSCRIAAVIGEIRRAGYDVFLILEATIGFNKRGEKEDDNTDTETGCTKEEIKAPPPAGFISSGPPAPKGRLIWTLQDQRFLRALKISIDEEQP